MEGGQVTQGKRRKGEYEIQGKKDHGGGEGSIGGKKEGRGRISTREKKETGQETPEGERKGGYGNLKEKKEERSENHNRFKNLVSQGLGKNKI